jgi:hypothetical protein
MFKQTLAGGVIKCATFFDIKYNTKQELEKIKTVLSEHRNDIDYIVFEDGNIIRVLESISLAFENDEKRKNTLQKIIDEIYDVTNHNTSYGEDIIYENKNKIQIENDIDIELSY